MAMILPERTVDAWTATYVTGRRWRARLWAPTEHLPDERYDLALGFGTIAGLPVPADAEWWPDKVFALEHKGVDEVRGAAVVWIRVRQLLNHLAADRARGGGLVYYVLPDPEWRGRQPAPYGVLPPVAARRTRGPAIRPGGRAAWDGFQAWAVVIDVETLYSTLRTIFVRIPSRFTPLPRRGRRPADWACRIPTAELWAIPNRSSLRGFVTGIRNCTHGRLATDRDIRQPGRGGPPDGTRAPLDRLGPSPSDLGAALGVGYEEPLDIACRMGRRSAFISSPRAPSVDRRRSWVVRGSEKWNGHTPLRARAHRQRNAQTPRWNAVASQP